LAGKFKIAHAKLEEISNKDKGELKKQVAEIASRLARTEGELAVTNKELARTREQSLAFETRLGKINRAVQTLQADVGRIKGGLDARIEKEVRRRMELGKSLESLASTANSAATNSRLPDK
jgi:chromosome segregation ATPase